MFAHKCVRVYLASDRSASNRSIDQLRIDRSISFRSIDRSIDRSSARTSSEPARATRGGGRRYAVVRCVAPRLPACGGVAATHHPSASHHRPTHACTQNVFPRGCGRCGQAMVARYPRAKWFALVDDDCFVVVDSLVQQLSAFDPCARRRGGGWPRTTVTRKAVSASTPVRAAAAAPGLGRRSLLRSL